MYLTPLRKKSLLLLLAILLPAHALLAQNIVNVNPLTGAANVVIPLLNYQRGSIRFPITLVYNGSGVKPTDVEGSAGIGFEIQAGGAVVRQLRGLPDDVQQDNADSTRTGWMYNTNQSIINGFTPANTGTPNCTYEASDISFINSNLSYTSDTEPDLFYVNAPGLSCQLVYDQTSGQFHPVEYQDLQISYTTGTNHQITSFTIINDQGVKYVFNVVEMAQQTIVGPVAPAYFGNTYYQYKNGITYAQRWMLGYIGDVNGNSISLTYSNGGARVGNDSVKLYLGGSTTASLQYVVQQSVTPKLDSLIMVTADEDLNIANETLAFTWQSPIVSGSGKTCIASIIGTNRDINFVYSGVHYTNHGGVIYYRSFLRSVSETNCGSPLDYAFAYAAETPDSGGFYYTTLLPDSSSSQVDGWGYYSANAAPNLQMPIVYASPTSSTYPAYLMKASSTNSGYYYLLYGNERSADTLTAAYGSLTQVTDVGHGGGTTTITYQSNDYYDPSYGGTVKGGGLRAKQITYYDSISTAHNMVRKYSYVNPSMGYSSGKPLTMPQYAFSIPYTGSATDLTLWTDATALSAYDLSTDDHTIMYEYERETMTGAGSTLSQFYVPATNWDASATPDCNLCTTPEWKQTIDLQARPTCVSYGPAYSNIQAYPFIPSSNYDFERGLPKKVTAYTDAGVEASETDYSYTRSANPSVIPAFKWEDNKSSGLTLRGYNKYSLYYNTRELLATQISKVYDAANHSQPNIDTVTYTYGPTYHKLYTRQGLNSDGNIATQTYFYVKDYPAAADTNGYITALYQLQLMNADWPVETYTTIKTHGGTTYYTQAALTLYRPFTPTTGTIYRPFRQLSWVQPNGLGFSPFAVNITGGAQAISYDANYFTSADFMDYDYYGVLQSSDDGNKREGSRFYDHITNKPVAVFTNARAGEVWFSDFDSDITLLYSHYTDSGGLGTVTDRNGKSAKSLTSAQYISYTLTKNTLAANYIFSAWLNTTGTPTVTITFTPTTGSVQTAMIHVTAATSGWQYFETPKVNVSGMTGNIAVKITTTATVSIDDILCYPENTEATTYAFDPVQFFKICETNTNGVSAYYKYDQWGRMLYAYDQDHYILKKSIYVTSANVQQFNGGVFNQSHQTNTHNITTFFSTSGATTACVNESTTYTFRFGDGAADSVVNTSGYVSHWYTVPGTYYATLTTRSPFFGVINSIDTVTVTAGPLTNISYTNSVSGYGNISTIAFYSGSTLEATFTAAQLTEGTAQITKGSYTMKVTMASGSEQYPYPTGGAGGYNGIVVTAG